MKDFKQIANENHISRQTIYNRIARLPNFKTKHLFKYKGKWFVNDSGVKLLNLPHKPARPKHYKRRNGFVKQDYIDEVHELKKKLSQRDRTIANFSYSFKKLANHTQSNQKQLTAKKSRPQKLPMGVSYSHDLDIENSNLRNKNSEQAKQIAYWKQKANDARHPILSRIFKHRK